MQAHPSFRAAALCVAMFAGATGVQAQVRSVAPAKPVAAPSASALATQSAPRATGLTSPAPAGLGAGSGARASSTPGIAANAVTTPGVRSTTVVNPASGTSTTTTTDATATTTTTTMLNSVVVDSAVASTDTGAALNAATVAANVSRGPAQTVGMGSSGLNPVDVARSFIRADGNQDGELSRAEAQRLQFALLSFEEMDRNFDGVVTRAEFEDGMR
jgi:hypothetical protein